MGKESARPQGANSGATANSGKNRGRVENLKPFQPGQSGNPSGRPKSTPITDALKEALSDPKLAREFVKGILKEARKGNAKAFAAVADRLEGKPAQSVTFEGELKGTVIVTSVPRPQRNA